MSAFKLSKWYADLTNEQGEAVIVYHAELSWRAITLNYSSLLTHTAVSGTRTRSSLRRHRAPTVTGSLIDWKLPEWKATGSWSQLGATHENILFQSSAGFLDWRCVASRAVAAVRIGAEPVISGWGYAEHLRLSIPPWQLPIRRLRWGRFINSTDALVWIDWDGPHTTRVVYFNGLAASATAIDDNHIDLADPEAVLDLENKMVIRDGRLGATALSVIPKIDRIFPPAILNTRECKWVSRAVLRRPSLPDSIGMAIHEVVEWP